MSKIFAQVPSSNPPASPGATELIAVARGTLADLHVSGAERLPIALDSTLDRDLSLDSLARVEFFSRVEREFHVRLPDSALQKAETLHDVLSAIGEAGAPALRAPETKPAPRPQRDVAAPPADLETLTEVLAWRAAQHPERTHITLCDEGGERQITHAHLLERAQAVAGGLQHHGIGAGDTVALMLPTSADYFPAFFGIVLAGATPVPLYPPARLSQIEEHVQRHTGILRNCGAALLITTSEMSRLARMLRAHTGTIHRISTVDDLCSTRTAPLTISVKRESLALLQYTSGSTGQPKGVALTHANLLANLSALGKACKVTSADVFVSWLPLYHDMGLIGAWLGSLYLGLSLVLMSPLYFLARPVRWLEAIHRHGGTLSAAPNFAYELCLKRISDAELAGLDLSTWRVAMNGAEAVMPQTVRRFQERFAPFGFRSTAMTPVYGMAESSVGLTFPPLERGPRIDVIQRGPFMTSGEAVPATADDPNPLSFVSCGRALSGHRIRIVDDSGRELTERVEGRLEFTGPSSTQGYFRNPQATARLIRDGWLDSGDRAYIANGEVFVTGRIKDIIIRAGQHIYPDELEAIVGAIDGVRKGCVAVFAANDAARGTERVVILAETHVTDPAGRESLRQQIIAKSVALVGEPPDEVVIAAPHTVLKTSSGKVRRAATRQLYESGRHQGAHVRAGWLQVLRISLHSVAPTMRRWWRQLIDTAYALYFWSLFAIIAVPTFLVILLPLPISAIWRTVRGAVWSFIRLAGISFAIEGSEGLPSQPVIVVANHSSYLDGLFLVAALPRPYRFVAKRELASVPLIGMFLRRLRVAFVERFDVRAGASDAQRLGESARSGNGLIFFPEGTFTRVPGVMTFHLGAFAAAAASRMAVLPIAICGARSMLRDEQWRARRASITVKIGQPIDAPSQNGFFAAVELRGSARRQILAGCNEPDLLEASGFPHDA